MAEFNVLNFERGFSDNYVNGPKNAGQKFENFIISRNRKIVSRDGSALFDSTLSQIPPGAQRIQFTKNHEDVLFEYSGDEIFYREVTFKELNGPVDDHDAFGDKGTAATSHNTASPWQKHLYTSIDSYCRPRKIYKDENDAWQIRNAGLPNPKEVRQFNTAIALANALKVTYNAHVADVVEHQITDTSIAAENASDIDTLIALVNQMKDLYIIHEADAVLGSPVIHQAQTSDDDSLAEEETIVTLAQAVTLLNDLKSKYNLHDADSTAHTTGGLHQESTVDATGEFTITPEIAASNSHIYGILYKFTYKVGTVTYTDRSAVSEVAIANGGDLSNDANGNDLSNIPALTNTVFGTKEAWDTDSIVVEIYRTDNNATTLKKLAEISNGTTTFEDDTTDANNTGITLYTNGGVLGNDEPPPCKFLVEANDILWYANVKEDSEEKEFRIRHSIQLDPDGAPGSFTIDLDDTITGIGAIGINPIVFTANKTYRLEGVVDSLGRGFVKKRVVDNSVGCISHNSIVQVKDGIYFASDDGFYFTNGFKTAKISNHLNESYKMLVSDAAAQKNIYGTNDPKGERIFWAVRQDETVSENDAIWAHDPFWGVPNGEGTFTTWAYNGNGNPTALEVIDGEVVRSDSRGYTFRHNEDLFTDPVIVTAVTPSLWETTAVLYDYRSSAFAFGSEFQIKWVTRLLTVLKSVTSIDIQPGSINNDSNVINNLKQINTSEVFVWGDPFFVWGDPTFIWNAPSTATGIRRFPRDGIRCIFKQVTYKNALAIFTNSDNLGSVTVDAIARTITLGGANIWPTDIINFQWLDDTKTDGLTITTRTDTVITVLDPLIQLVSGTVTAWTLRGFTKNQRLHIEGYVIIFEFIGKSHTAFRVGDGGANA